MLMVFQCAGLGVIVNMLQCGGSRSRVRRGRKQQRRSNPLPGRLLNWNGSTTPRNVSFSSAFAFVSFVFNVYVGAERGQPSSVHFCIVVSNSHQNVSFPPSHPPHPTPPGPHQPQPDLQRKCTAFSFESSFLFPLQLQSSSPNPLPLPPCPPPTQPTHPTTTPPAAASTCPASPSSHSKPWASP